MTKRFSLLLFDWSTGPCTLGSVRSLHKVLTIYQRKHTELYCTAASDGGKASTCFFLPEAPAPWLPTDSCVAFVGWGLSKEYPC